MLIPLQDLDRSSVALAGGKGANLGELFKLEGLGVPDGFCVTTAAFDAFVAGAPEVSEALHALLSKATDRPALAAALRVSIESAPLPQALEEAIVLALARLGGPVAVRSSATTEDAPDTSFAGQYDTVLDVSGAPAVLAALRRCWASAYSERAIAYRDRQGQGAAPVRLAVVIQRLVPAEVSGVLFTADPVTGHRRVCVIDAAPGLGEALVSGQINPEQIRVRGGEILSRSGPPSGLTDAMALALEAIGRRLEAHFGAPQDVEWCQVGSALHIVQSRPITTLFPLPEAPPDARRIYMSVGHQQMMTDAMKPLGWSFFQLLAGRVMYSAGGRLFVDVWGELSSPAQRAALVGGMSRVDPLTGSALQRLVSRGDVPLVQPASDEPRPLLAPQPTSDTFQPRIPDPAAAASALVALHEAEVATLARELPQHTGVALFEAIEADVQRLKALLRDPRSMGLILTAMDASAWLNDRCAVWLGEVGVADVLTWSVDHNVTSEMGLALMDVADAMRPHPEVVARLERGGDDALEGLDELEGGPEASEVLRGFLQRYGARCPGEIDLTRPRWAEQPSALLPLLLNNVRNFAPGEAARRFERGRRGAELKRDELVARLRAGPDGEARAEALSRAVDLLRAAVGFREYPKFAMMSRTYLYRKALLGEAQRLVAAGVIHESHDVEYLTFEEYRSAVLAQRVDPALIAARRVEHQRALRLSPPRLMSSDGEIILGAYGREAPTDGLLVGLPVSAGVVEGRARVVLDLGSAVLEEGDILVTAFTDPSWTPLFVSLRGLVTEVGGLMTHGAVIAREYGLPAVVGVENATRRIHDGQRVRVNGTEGTVELL